MLSIKFGNLFDYAEPGSMIVHGANCQGKMAKGFASEIRRRFPLAYLEYAQLHRESGLVLGEYLSVYCDKYCIFHAFTQEHYGNNKDTVYVDYESVEKTMRAAARMAKQLKMRVYLPLIGGGLANGDPAILYCIFKRSYASVEACLVLPEGYAGASIVQTHQ